MSLEVHIFATEKEANDFLEPYMQKNYETLEQLQQRESEDSLVVSNPQQKDGLLTEVVCPLVLIANKAGYFFQGGVQDFQEINDGDYASPAELAAGVREALVEYINFLPQVQLQPLFLTIQEKSSVTLDEVVQEAKELIGELSEEVQKVLYAEIGGEEGLREEAEEILYFRGLTQSEVQEFQQEYQKVPKGLN